MAANWTNERNGREASGWCHVQHGGRRLHVRVSTRSSVRIVKPLLQVLRNDTNCRIFRHGTHNYNQQQIPQHLSKVECDRLVEEDEITGCGRPFQLVLEDKPSASDEARTGRRQETAKVIAGQQGRVRRILSTQYVQGRRVLPDGGSSERSTRRQSRSGQRRTLQVRPSSTERRCSAYVQAGTESYIGGFTQLGPPD